MELQEDIYLFSGFLITIERLYLVNYYIWYVIIPHIHDVITGNFRIKGGENKDQATN